MVITVKFPIKGTLGSVTGSCALQLVIAKLNASSKSSFFMVICIYLNNSFTYWRYKICKNPKAESLKLLVENKPVAVNVLNRVKKLRRGKNLVLDFAFLCWGYFIGFHNYTFLFNAVWKLLTLVVNAFSWAKVKPLAIKANDISFVE